MSLLYLFFRINANLVARLLFVGWRASDWNKVEVKPSQVVERMRRLRTSGVMMIQLLLLRILCSSHLS
jgi:hypothetical protein